MKKIIALIFALIFALSLTSCTVSKTGGKDDASKTEAADSADRKDNNNKKDAASDTGKPSAAVDYSKELKKLNGKQKKFVDNLGESKNGEKLVAYFGDVNETQVIVGEFKNGKVSKVRNYRFFELDAQFDMYDALSNKSGMLFTVHKDEKCVEMDETRKYSGKTYDEMVKLLEKYDFK